MTIGDFWRRRKRPPVLGADTTVRLTYLFVFAVAFVLRLLVPLTSGGLVGNYSYDAGVYYSASAALLRGRLPYRDFILLHPPGVALAAAPAAWIGRLTNVHIGFAIALVEFTALGAASAVLVVVVARGLGAHPLAAAAGGTFYAVWFLSVRAEYLIRLEPLGNVLVLCALVAYTRTRDEHSTRWALLTGAALGAAASVKIWYVVPLAVVLCFLAARCRRRAAAWAALGAAGAATAINGPFFALAPSRMWRMVVSEQLGRDQTNPFRALLTLQRFPRGLSWQAACLLDMFLLVGIGVVLLMAWRAPAVRLPAALLLTSGAVLLAAPSWYLFYADSLTPAAALCVATGAAAIAAARHGPWTRLTRACAPAGALVVLLMVVGPAKALWYRPAGRASLLPSPQLTSAAQRVRCVMSDSPMALIELNALDRNLANGCPDWVDVTGRTYSAGMRVRDQRGRPVPRIANLRWQQALRGYLLSGDAVLIMRPRDSGISQATWDAVRRGGVLAAGGSDVIYVGQNRSPAEKSPHVQTARPAHSKSPL